MADLVGTPNICPQSIGQVFAQTNQEFNYIDIEARYQLGKFTLSASYDHNVLNTGSGPTFGGSTFNRFRLRLTRSFTIF